MNTYLDMLESDDVKRYIRRLPSDEYYDIKKVWRHLKEICSWNDDGHFPHYLRHNVSSSALSHHCHCSSANEDSIAMFCAILNKRAEEYSLEERIVVDDVVELTQ